jgi:Zn-dependent protease with chaperone function
MYYLLGICLALAALLCINAFTSVIMATLWRFINRPACQWSALARANLLFALRILPPVCSLICVVTLLLPAYIVYEPYHSSEIISAKLVFLALVSIFGLTFAAWRGIASWHVTRRLVADWLRHAELVFLDGVSIPAYRFEHAFPVVAIVGAVRPRLFIAAQLFDTLSAEEMSAAIRHETGHLAALDNLKRPLLRASCDVLSLVPCGRSLDRAWKQESEIAADEYTADLEGKSGALALASALIKIARMIPEGTKPTMPAGAFLNDAAGDNIAKRIRQLVQSAEIETPHRNLTPAIHFVVWTLLCGFLGTIAFLIVQTNVLTTLHGAIERFVSAVQ